MYYHTCRDIVVFIFNLFLAIRISFPLPLWFALVVLDSPTVTVFSTSQKRDQNARTLRTPSLKSNIKIVLSVSPSHTFYNPKLLNATATGNELISPTNKSSLSAAI